MAVNKFEDIVRPIVDNFGNIYKEKEIISIIEVVRMTSLFPSFVNEVDNFFFMEDVSREEV
jgi:hypothetical protein